MGLPCFMCLILIWQQTCEISCGFCAPPEPMRCLDRDYSILAMEEAAISKNCTFQRLDVPLKALVDGAAIEKSFINDG